MSELRVGSVIDKNKRKENLKTVVDYLNAKGLKWTLMCGTLLGCMREKDFIEWDSDIDIGVVGRDFNKIDISYFKEKGFSGLGNCLLYKKTNIMKDGISIDFYNIKRKSNYILFDIGNTFQYEMFRKISYFIKGEQKKGSVPEKSLLEESPLQVLQHMLTIPNYKYFPYCDFIQHKFVGLDVFIPKKWEEWLVLLYGSNWRIPNKNYTDSKERQKNRRMKKI